MERCPEPQELMDDPEQVRAYACADFEAAHRMEVKFLQNWLPQLESRHASTASILDIGCGSADVTIRVARTYAPCQVDAVDGSAQMLQCAQDEINAAGLSSSIRLFHKTLPATQWFQANYDLICSNSTLHHMHEPQVLWQAICQVVSPDCAIFVTDLIRPDNIQAARDCVERYSAHEPEILRRDFYNSLLAACRPEEVCQQLQDVNMSYLRVEKISDRHMAIYGHCPE